MSVHELHFPCTLKVSWYTSQLGKAMFVHICILMLKVTSDSFADINECDYNNGGCQQTCTNMEGSYTCQCRNGFTLREDYRTCAGEWSMVKFEV